MPIAAIDCGTNSVRLLIASLDSEGNLVNHERKLELVRLGEGVDATRKFSDGALERAFTTFRNYAQIIDQYCCEKVRLVATSAARDATNREVFFTGVKEILGIEADIITGQEEAELSFSGAISGLPTTLQQAASATQGSNILVTDCGGGSTELVAGDSTGRIGQSISLNIGSVRIRERYLESDPPTESEIAAATQFINQQLDQSGIDFSAIETWIGVAGTITSMSAINQGLISYDPTLIHQSKISKDQIHQITNNLLETKVETLIQQGLLKPRRAEIICAGALIIDQLNQRIPVGLTVSETDILDGIALNLLKN